MLSFKLVSSEMCGKTITITSYFKDESQSLKKEYSDKTNDASNNSSSSKSTHAPQDINSF